MSELISRQAVMDATKTVMKDVLDSLPTALVDGEEIYDVRTSELDLILGINKALQNAIKSLPSANRSGKWIEIEYGDGDISYMCNQCKSEFALLDGTPLDNGYYFCPHCGSRNIEEGGEKDD